MSMGFAQATWCDTLILIIVINVAKCNLGEVKLKRVGPRSSPIAVRDMWGGPLGS